MTEDPKGDEEGGEMDPFGRPLETSAPVIVPPEDLPRLIAERDAEESDGEDDEDDLSDLDEVEEALTQESEERKDDLVAMMGRR